MDIPWPDDSIFEPFDIIEEAFKTVDSHDIKAAILIPKGLEPGTHPVLYHLHGGFLVAGHGLYAPFFGRWEARLAVKHGAIIISPDYRLLPTANGVADQLEDVVDCWEWTKEKLPGILQEKAPGHALDFSRVLLQGSSAGGYVSTELAFHDPDGFKVLALTYPLLDLKDSLYLHGPGPDEPNVFNSPDEDILPLDVVRPWIEEKRKVIESRASVEKTAFAVGATHGGIFFSELVDNKGLDRKEFYPIERVKDGERLPDRIWILHGNRDSTVPIRGSYKFAAALGDKFPKTVVRFDSVLGQDHAFEIKESTWADIAPDAMEFLTQSWLSQE